MRTIAFFKAMTRNWEFTLVVIFLVVILALSGCAVKDDPRYAIDIPGLTSNGISILVEK